MRQALITISRGIIGDVAFFDDPKMAVMALEKFVKNMNVDHEDAALYDQDGLVANAKHFLDDRDEYWENNALIQEVSGEKDKPIYIIANPLHPLGFMVASPDDPLGYRDPADALCDLGQARQDYGKHLRLYRVLPVTAPVAGKDAVEKHITDLEVEDFDYSLIEEYVGNTCE